MAPYKVLVPLDGSRLAEHSLVYINPLQSLGEAQVMLFSVVDEAENSRVLNASDAESLRRAYLREVSTLLEQRLGIKVQTKIVSGSSASRVLEEASASAPDLLIVTTHGHSGDTRWRLGSVADKIIRGASGNTLVVGPQATDRSAWIDGRKVESFKSLLVPLDGSPLAEKALPVAVNFAKALGSLIHLVQVVRTPLADVNTGRTPPSLLSRSLESANIYLCEIASTIPSQEVRTDVLIGGASSQLEDYARAFDIMIMTSHGHGGFRSTALGSVTDRMVGGPTPVLIVRARIAE